MDTDALKQWLTLDNVLTAWGLFTFLVLPFAGKILRALGFERGAKIAEEITAQSESALLRAERAEKSLASVLDGVQDARVLLDPAASKNLVSILRQKNEDNGVESIIRPAVEALQAGVKPLPAVQAQTGKFKRVA